MATSNQGVVSVHNSTDINLYNTTTDQFGKTVFTSPGRVKTIVFDTVDVTTGANVSYNSTTGVFSLNANVTYQLVASARIDSYQAPAGEPPALVWVDKTIGGVVGQPVPVDYTNVTTYRPAQDTTVVLTAATCRPSLPLTWDYPNQLTNATATVSVVSGWIE